MYPIRGSPIEFCDSKKVEIKKFLVNHDMLGFLTCKYIKKILKTFNFLQKLVSELRM